MLVRPDGVEAAHGQSDEPVGGGVADEAAGDDGGQLDGLRGDGGAADVDGVGADTTSGLGAVAVGDAEGLAVEILEGFGYVGVVIGVAGSLGRWHVVIEDPPVDFVVS